ncbi:hypothetical protein NCAS_0B02650 [Naumovozyma castellii]|uniref:Suppressor of forked domain-containing protein n=1 Tax=Naumovozyma castellii TaxID=27288 RepID=G0VBM3_NAUCA|nr:hypothetical protein NCAS_0B02650 [Naumovozyma castellii CBS 4309]CCC68349.1 hypothetical protein NCAS_0B02650 [Naumovozyma castellii CBS 4309]
MDKYNSLLDDEKFSSLTLQVTKFPRELSNWEALLNHLILFSSPLNKALDPQIQKLIRNTYTSMLFYFPYLENYYVDYALFEYKLGNVSKMHKIFKHALNVFNQRSLLIWVSYLKLCNEVIPDSKQLFKKYELAERFIGLHFLSGEFWDLYLEQLQERCANNGRYLIVLRKILEIPLHSFSKFYAIWLRQIDSINDLSQLCRIAPQNDLLNKLKIDVKYNGRRGPYLAEAKTLIKKSTKELYTVVQCQVLDIFSLFESKLYTHYFTSQGTLISSDEISTWEKYLEYTINLNVKPLTHLNFQRALIPLAAYDIVWIKYAQWLIEKNDDLVTAKNVLLRALSMSLKKTSIMRFLYSILSKMNQFDTLSRLLEQVETSYLNEIEKSDDFDIFWDFIQFQIFMSKTQGQSRYSNSQTLSLLPPKVFDKIIKRLSYGTERSGQEMILEALLQLQTKENTQLIEEQIFQYLINTNIEYYTKNAKFWSLYCHLIFFDPSKSYLERRAHIVNNIWKKASKYSLEDNSSLHKFCESYLPDDLDAFEDLFVV